MGFVMILLAIFLPPAAVFASGKPIQGIVNLCLYIMSWFGLFFFVIPGVLLWGIACAHACYVVVNHGADKRTQKITNAIVANALIGKEQANGALPPSRSADYASPPVAYDSAKFDALMKYDDEIRSAVEEVRPLGERWIAELGREYLLINSKEYLPRIIAKIRDDAAREAEEMRNRPYVVEEGFFNKRKWRRFNTGEVEAESLGGGTRRFASLDEFKAFIS